MHKDFWINRDMMIFHMSEYGPQAWPRVCIWRILWRGESERVILNGILPMNAALSNFPDGATLEVQHGCHGDPTRYMDGATAIRLTDCRVRNKWIPRPVICKPDHTSVVELFVEVNCGIKMVGLR